jgi:hypothetical protein
MVIGNDYIETGAHELVDLGDIRDAAVDGKSEAAVRAP